MKSASPPIDAVNGCCVLWNLGVDLTLVFCQFKLSRRSTVYGLVLHWLLKVYASLGLPRVREKLLKSDHVPKPEIILEKNKTTCQRNPLG